VAPDRLPSVRLFVMGADEWRDYDDWPVPGAVATDAFLAEGGTLVWDTVGLSGETAVPYDPADPAPTVGGAVLFGAPDFPGAHDQRPAESHPGVISFTTAPFTDTLDVVGPISLVAWVAVDPAGSDDGQPGVDADLHATLTDVAPDGTSRLLTDGAIRLSRREGLDRIVAVPVGTPVEVTVDLWATGNAVLPGHRLRLNLAGANFPRYVLSEQPVTLRVLHDAAHPSRLVVPVLPTL